MKEILRKWYPVFFGGFIWFVLQYNMKAWMGDEFMYASLLEENSLWDVVARFYYSWSSRIIFDTLCAIFHHYPLIIFKVVNSVVFALFYLGICKLCRMDSIREQWIVVALGSGFNYLTFYDCGFSVTSIYYVWPVTAGIWAVFLFVRNTHNITYMAILLEIVFTAIADNMEQVFIIVSFCQIIVVMESVITKRKNPIAMAGALTSLASFLFIITCPGREMRFTKEIGNNFAEYNMLSLTQKMDIGFSTTIKKLMFSGSSLWIVLTIFLFLLIMKSDKERWEKGIGAIPMCIALVYGPLNEIVSSMFPYINSVGELSTYGSIDLTKFDLMRKWVPLLFMVFAFASVLIALWLHYDNTCKGWLVIGLLVAAFLSRVAMGFSPTIYVSGDRTTYPMLVAIVVINCLMAKELIEKNPKTVLYLSSFVGIMQTFMFTLQIH